MQCIDIISLRALVLWGRLTFDTWLQDDYLMRSYQRADDTILERSETQRNNVTFFFAAFFRWWIQCSLLYILNFHPQSTKYWEGEDFAAGNSFPRPPGAEEPWLLMWQSCWWPHTDYNAKHGRTSWPGAQWKWTKHRIWSIWSSFSPQKRFLSSGGIAHLKRQTQRTCRAAAS